MKLKPTVNNLESLISIILKWTAYITGLAALAGYVLKFYEWGNKGVFSFFSQNIQGLWISTAILLILLLFIWVSSLHRRFIRGFQDSFTKDLRLNWDYEGNWRCPEKGTLLVTGVAVGPQDGGGITKVGAHWENYTLSFSARILRDCLGVIVRAQDLNNYYMFQIRSDMIRPHRRVAVPVVAVQANQQNQPAPQIHPVQFTIGWQIIDPPMPLIKNLNDWFDVSIKVRGESIHLLINDEIAFQSDSFLKIPSGKIGFRNNGAEEALVKKVKVILNH
ncbi:MAG: family 16 glycoside hydrolase [Bacteroidota bacterium]|jgi:hypothetical protein